MAENNTNRLTPETFVFPAIETIDTPPAGHIAIANKAGVMYSKDNSETETPLGGGSFDDFLLAGDSGTPQTISDGNTLTIEGGTGIDTVAGATDKVTVAIDSTVATLTGAQTLANKILSQLHLLIGGFKAIFTHAFTADRTVTLPGDADVTLVGLATTQTPTNKTLSHSANTIGYGTPVTKTLASDVCSAGTDRNLIVAAQTGTSDTLREVTGLTVGERVLLRADAGDEITVSPNDPAATVKIILNATTFPILDEQNPLYLTLVATNVLAESIFFQQPYFDISSGNQFTIESSTYPDAFFMDTSDPSIPKVGIGDTNGSLSQDYLLRLFTDSGSGYVGALGLPEMTSGERIGLDVDNGAMVYDTDLGLVFAQNATAWTPILVGAEGIQFINPHNQTWNTLNQASGTFTLDTTNKSITILADGDGSLDIRGWYCAAPSAPYSIRAKILCTFMAGTNSGMAFGFRENATGELHLLCYHYNASVPPELRALRFNSPTSFSAAVGTTTIPLVTPTWFKLEDDNTNKKLYSSVDGINWMLHYSEARTTFMTPDQIFFGAILQTANAFDTQITMLSYEEL
jgi:hypothetical protein